MAIPFSRKSDPVRVPVSRDSAAIEFSMPQTPSMMANRRKTFMFVNPTPYDVRLEGTMPDAPFVPVRADTGWLIPARAVMGPFTSKNPAKLSAQAFSTPGNPIPDNAVFDGCFLELLYGEGE